jgi:hypothetical protein
MFVTLWMKIMELIPNEYLIYSKFVSINPFGSFDQF